MSDLEQRITETLAPLRFAEGRQEWDSKWEEVSPRVRAAWKVLAREYAVALTSVITEAQADAWHKGFCRGEQLADREPPANPRALNPYGGA